MCRNRPREGENEISLICKEAVVLLNGGMCLGDFLADLPCLRLRIFEDLGLGGGGRSVVIACYFTVMPTARSSYSHLYTRQQHVDC